MCVVSKPGYSEKTLDSADSSSVTQTTGVEQVRSGSRRAGGIADNDGAS